MLSPSFPWLRTAAFFRSPVHFRALAISSRTLAAPLALCRTAPCRCPVESAPPSVPRPHSQARSALTVWAPEPLPITPPAFCIALSTRSVLQLEGERTEVMDFLQGLLTCDVRRLQPDHPVWGCFLEFNGRVLADAYLYEHPDAVAGVTRVWIELERGLHTELVLDQLLEMRMRRKIRIEDVSERVAVVAEYDTPQATPPLEGPRLALSHAMASFPDPRHAVLHPLTGSAALRKHFLPREWAPQPVPSDPYQLLLALHGVGEGATVFPSRKCTPFDGNADLLAEGVSFHKGCYIGQELTHRTHVVLVIRKRLLPVAVRGTPPLDSLALVADDTSRAGKLCGALLPLPDGCPTGLRVGLAVVRLEQLSEETGCSGRLHVRSSAGDVEAQAFAHIPHWWSSKEVRKTFRKLRQAAEKSAGRAAGAPPSH